jgi:hypothetical protein
MLPESITSLNSTVPFSERTLKSKTRIWVSSRVDFGHHERRKRRRRNGSHRSDRALSHDDQGIRGNEA